MAMKFNDELITPHVKIDLDGRVGWGGGQGSKTNMNLLSS